MSITSDEKIGIILMTYGSATTAEHVADYFAHIYKGRSIPPTLIKDFENRYRLVGRSPLIDVTEGQASELQKSLGEKYIVRVGMRHSAPFIESAVTSCKEGGATSLRGIILSPQFSARIMEGYNSAFLQAAQACGISNAVVASPWPTERHFVELLATRVRDGLAAIKKKTGVDAPIIFTTHSLPRSVVEQDETYLSQLQATIDAIRKELDPGIEWYAGYQSAGHTPEEWLKPDLADILTELNKKNTSAVLVVPIQFLADHLEILYDLDIAARQQCESLGVRYNRIELPNTNPLFIGALASITKGAAESR